MFIRSLQHKYVGYGLTTTRSILDHLYTTYTNISSADEHLVYSREKNFWRALSVQSYSLKSAEAVSKA